MNFCQVFTPNKGPKEGCYVLSVDYKTRVKIVDTNKTYQDFMADMRHSVTRVGLAYVPSWLCIATDQKIYLLDFKALSKALSNSEWFKMGSDFLRKKEITKCAWDPAQVIEFYGKSVSTLKKYMQEMTDQGQVCDVKATLTGNREHFGSNPQTLSQAVEFFFEKPIDEEPLDSDWTKKPLNDPQKIYAAVQAHSVLMLINAMRKTAKAKGVEIQLPF